MPLRGLPGLASALQSFHRGALNDARIVGHGRLADEPRNARHGLPLDELSSIFAALNCEYGLLRLPHNRILITFAKIMLPKKNFGTKNPAFVRVVVYPDHCHGLTIP